MFKQLSVCNVAMDSKNCGSIEAFKPEFKSQSKFTNNSLFFSSDMFCSFDISIDFPSVSEATSGTLRNAVPYFCLRFY